MAILDRLGISPLCGGKASFNVASARIRCVVPSLFFSHSPADFGYDGPAWTQLA
jgi:hypothetical protein